MPLDAAEAIAAQTTIADARRIDPDRIPIIDVSALASDDGAAHERVGYELADAFVSMGFCYLSGHGVPQKLIDDAFAALPRFFEHDVAQKNLVPINKNMRGFMGMHRHTQVHGKKPNRSESFIFGTDLPANDPDRLAGKPFHDTNYWPPVANFREPLEAYWRALQPFAYRLLRGISLSMGQPAGFLDAMYKKPDSLLRCVHYPPALGEFDGQFGAGPHTDNGSLTILAQDNVGGLQIKTMAGEWIDALPIPGTFVFNVGDMIMRLTNGRFRSTPHRVVSAKRTRYSMPLFFFTDYDARIAPLPNFVDADHPPQFEPIIWGDYLQGEFFKAYDHYKEKPTA